MNARRILLSLLIAGGVLSAMCQSSDAVVRDKMTSAVMKVYDDHLAQNPSDYNVLFARAHQHYYNGDYTAALTDVNQAMKFTPATDKELRFDEYILRARISDVRQDYISELADLRLAQELQPKSLGCTDLIAKANLKAGNLSAAEKAFKTILRAESMNYDAMYGLAQVELARGHLDAAISQASKAVALFRTEPQVYVNRADIYARQGDITSAVVDLLNGMSVGNGGDAAYRLFELSDKHYDSVMQSLADLANRTPSDAGTYRYLRANIAIDHNHFGQALEDLHAIKRGHLYESPSVDYNIAKCCLETARYDEAITHVDQAITAAPNEPEFYIVKALAEYYVGEGGHTDAAMEALNRCSLTNPQYVPMLLTKAELLCDQGKDKSALGYLNAAVAAEPANAEALFSRALVLKRMGLDKLALRDLNTIAMQNEDPYFLKGLALNEMGRDTDMFKWLSTVTANTEPGGENFYYAALLMAKRGDGFKAIEFLHDAIVNGYGSIHRLQHDVLSPVNLKSLRGEQRFEQVVKELEVRN